MPERRAVTQEADSQLKLLETCLSRINDIVIVTEAEPIDEPGPRILYVNDAFVRRTGYTREEALGRTPRLLQGPNTDRDVLDQIHASMQAWQPCRVELVNYTKTGEEYWVELDVVPVADERGWYTHWVAVERDITARRQAASAVAESERMAQATLDALPSPVCVLDEAGRIQTTNLAWRVFTVNNAGRPQFTWEGANYLDVCQDFANRHPDDDDAQLLVRELQSVLSGTSATFQLQYPCHSPTEARWFEARISRFPGSGPRRVAVVHLDVTGFKQAELREAMQARIMTLLANGAPLMAVLDAIVRGVEAENPTLLGSVLLFDAALGQLVHGAAPSLPAFYSDAVSGLVPGPAAGSCGTAAWRLERVIVEDIASNPLWRDYAEVALRAGLHACWSQPVRDSAGKLLGTFAIYHRTRRAPADSEIRLITAAARFAAVAIERTRDEAALQESEARFANAFEFAAVGVGLVGPDGHWLKVNRALCDMLGYGEAELLGKHFNDITHPDDRDLSLEIELQLQSGARDSFQVEKRYLHRLGRVVWVHLSVSQIRAANGQPLYEVCQVQDITAQKSAENERDTLFELSPDMLCVAYIDGRFKQVNPAWSRTLGWSTAELLGMSSYLELVHPADFDATLAAGQRLREGHAVPDFENRFRCRDGGYRLLSWHSFPLPDVGVSFAVVRDITEHAAADEARRAADQRAGERQRMEALGSLAGGIAHDFNNNLAVMLGNVTLARRALGNDSPVLEKLAQIEIAGQRAVALVQQILAFSRRQPQQLRVQALGCIVAETLRLLRATIPAGIALDTYVEDDAPPILADATQLHQILMNLCTNAWHAIEARHGQGGMIEVRVETCTNAAPGDAVEPRSDAREVCLTVRDNGIGMEATTRARLFEPFFTTREVGEGTGLGMSVVHGIVAAHHGTISVDSTPGVGTTVRVSFPAATVDGAGAAVAHDQPPTAAAARRGAHVLYIDDEQQLVMLAREMLEDDGYTVTGLIDAAAALAAVRANPQGFDLVITDFNMPALSGFDIVREIATLRADLPVIIASGNITPAMQLEAARLGVRRLLQKPDIATSLRPLVREVLGSG